MTKWFLPLLLFSGCISISTYEQQMKKCRDTGDQLGQANANLASLQARNGELEKLLEESSHEQEKLKTEISSYDELVQELKDNIARGEVGVQKTDKGVTITVGNQILFASGRADLQVRGRSILSRVAAIIRKSDGQLIQVEGHTDNLRIASALKSVYPSNWELSAARAASVVRYLQQEGQIDPTNLVLMAYAENQPTASNETPEGRQQNRRVEITLVPK